MECLLYGEGHNMKKKYVDGNDYIRALQRGESDKSATSRAESEWEEKFHPIQRFKSWRYRNKQKKIGKDLVETT